MKIRLSEMTEGQYYFIVTANFTACTSGGFSILFNIDVDIFNQLLIDKVIKHKNYLIERDNKDMYFTLNGLPKETYIERFKDAFTNELTLISLGGDLIEN